MEKFIKNKRRNIHTAGGSSGTDYKTESKTDSYTAENGTKENVIGKIIISENLVTDFKKNRVAERAENGGHCKGFSENKIAYAKHYNVENQNKGGDGNMKEMFNYKGNTGRSAQSYARRKNEKLYGQSIDDISYDNAEKREKFLPEIFDFIHLNSPFKIIKKRLPRIFPDKRGSKLTLNT